MRWHDRAGGGCRGDPLSPAQPQQGRRGAGPARPGRPQAVRGGGRALLAAQTALTIIAGEATALVDATRRGRWRRPRRWHDASRRPRWCSPPAPSSARGCFAARSASRRADRRARGDRDGAMQLRALGLPMARLKTGTPPRLDGRSIDWARLERQPSDDEPLDDVADVDGRAAAAARLRDHAHQPSGRTTSSAPRSTGRRCSPVRSRAPGRAIARRSRTRCTASATATGIRSSSSPRGSTTPSIYPNGISTSLPADAQAAMIAIDPGARSERDHRFRLCGRI